jgi:hypothetical protein
MANGGWISGRLAETVGLRAAAVTLRAPVPLETPLRVEVARDRTVLCRDGELLAEIEPLDAWPLPPLPIDRADAVRAQTSFAGFTNHPFPGCFVCGTERFRGDGLHVHAGPVPGRHRTVAAPWRPDGAHADGSGRIPLPVITAALGCPTAWAHLEPGGAARLGRLSFAVMHDVRVGEDLVVVGEQIGREGRELSGAAGLFDRDGRCLAVSAATWIEVPASTV